jgi:hypothetical protein
MSKRILPMAGGHCHFCGRLVDQCRCEEGIFSSGEFSILDQTQARFEQRRDLNDRVMTAFVEHLDFLNSRMDFEGKRLRRKLSNALRKLDEGRQ